MTIGDLDLMNYTSGRPTDEWGVTYLKGVQATSDITRSHLDQLSEYSQVRFQPFAFTDLPQSLDQELSLRFLEPDDSSERS